MAKKRDQREGMPASPLAGKLAIEATRLSAPEPATVAIADAQPSAHHDEEQPNAAAPKEKRGALKRGRASRLAKAKEARVMMAQDELVAIEETVRTLRQISQSTVNFSHLARAMFSLASRAVPAIKANAESIDLPPRPANNDRIQLARYEDALADFMLLALRDRRSMDVE